MFRSFYELEKRDRTIYDGIHEYCLTEKVNEEQLRASDEKKKGNTITARGIITRMKAVFMLSKPTSCVAITHGLDFLAAARERLRRLEKKALSIEEKMEEIRLVNRAKWLLIDHLKMSEPDAHRYLTKQAMDTCVTRSEVAKEIIRTYS